MEESGQNQGHSAESIAHRIQWKLCRQTSVNQNLWSCPTKPRLDTNDSWVDSADCIPKWWQLSNLRQICENACGFGDASSPARMNIERAQSIVLFGYIKKGVRR